MPEAETVRQYNLAKDRGNYVYLLFFLGHQVIFIGHEAANLHHRRR
jgi:hypothetical protein